MSAGGQDSDANDSSTTSRYRSGISGGTYTETAVSISIKAGECRERSRSATAAAQEGPTAFSSCLATANANVLADRALIATSVTASLEGANATASSTKE